MTRVMGMFLIVAVCLAPLSAEAADRVEVESKTVYGNSTVTLGVYLENDVSVYGVTIPLAFRSMSGGAYPDVITGGSGGRLTYSGDFRDPLSGLRLVMEFVDEDGVCNGNIPGFGAIVASAWDELTTTNPTDPVCLTFVRNSVAPETPLPPGSDFPIGAGDPSFVTTLSLPNVAGTFLIDTTCSAADNHLLFADGAGQPIAPSFNAGVVTVLHCDCPHQCDLDGNGVLDGVDLNAQIQVLFFNAPDPQDTDCPATRGDFNVNGVTDVADLNLFVSHLYFNQSGPLDPCTQ